MTETDAYFVANMVPQDVTGSPGAVVALTVPQYNRLLRLARRGAAVQVYKAESDALKSEINTKLERLNHIPTTIQLTGWSLGVGLTVLGIVIAFMSVLGDRWDNGMNLGSAVGQQIKRNNSDINRTQESVDAVLKKMDNILLRLEDDAKSKCIRR